MLRECIGISDCFAKMTKVYKFRTCCCKFELRNEQKFVLKLGENKLAIDKSLVENSFLDLKVMIEFSDVVIDYIVEYINKNNGTAEIWEVV